jgi:hypothetical protein
MTEQNEDVTPQVAEMLKEVEDIRQKKLAAAGLDGAPAKEKAAPPEPDEKEVDDEVLESEDEDEGEEELQDGLEDDSEESEYSEYKEELELLGIDEELVKGLPPEQLGRLIAAIDNNFLERVDSGRADAHNLDSPAVDPNQTNIPDSESTDENGQVEDLDPEEFGVVAEVIQRLNKEVSKLKEEIKEQRSGKSSSAEAEAIQWFDSQVLALGDEYKDSFGDEPAELLWQRYQGGDPVAGKLLQNREAMLNKFSQLHQQYPGSPSDLLFKKALRLVGPSSESVKQKASEKLKRRSQQTFKRSRKASREDNRMARPGVRQADYEKVERMLEAMLNR